MSNWSYFNFVELPEEVKQAYKIRSKNRLDCISYFSPDETLRGYTFFVNFKGMLYMNKSQPRSFVNADIKRQTDLALINSVKGNSYNISSIYIDIPDRIDIGYGWPSNKKMLGSKGEKPNPLFAFKNDLYIFIMNQERSQIELIVIPEMRHLWLSFYQRFLNDDFCIELDELRERATALFSYSNR
ncbi:hypothetical protein SAMN05421640_0541 [Ekhidna lutea]|uniref:Uncharacterized protein n=1 Tax=Ekhidna lutea TaxID=447679 RepID=A0A239F996_EKHLU|nr:hypothetical protein [Ekhidna lutea]SNS53058.1 hypothetical protein SAMN05421640_0541 [Ekhidna lutea]